MRMGTYILPLVSVKDSNALHPQEDMVDDLQPKFTLQTTSAKNTRRRVRFDGEARIIVMRMMMMMMSGMIALIVRTGGTDREEGTAGVRRRRGMIR